eukprot:855340-Amphidinium_carterae.1
MAPPWKGSYHNRQHRGATPEPRQRIEDVNELTGQEYFADEYFAEGAAKEDDIDNAHYKQYSFNVMGFNKLL